jgi:TolB-like protein
MTTFRRIRDRRLVQISLTYAGGAWAVLELFDQLVDRGIVPELVYKIALIWVVVGIPGALLVGWYHGEKVSQGAPKSEIIALAVLALIALAFSGNQVLEHRAEAQIKAAADQPLEMRRLAVLYFEDHSSGQSHDYLADALTESLIDQLALVRDLDVISRTGSAQYRGSGLAADSIAQLLGAGTIIMGSIEEKGDRLRVDVRIVDGSSGAQLGRAGFERGADEVLALRDSLAAQTALLLRQFLGPEIRLRDAARGSTNTQAWLLLQRAEKARKNAEALAVGEPVGRQLYDHADELLAQAERLDPQWAEPVIARAAVSYRRAYRSQTSPLDAYAFAMKSLEQSERALRLDRNNARALEVRGTANYFIVLLGVTPDPATQEQLLVTAHKDLETAVQLNPSLATAHATLSHLYYRQGDMAKTVISAQSALIEDAYLEAADLVLWRLFNGSWELGDFTSATRWCDQGMRRFPQNFRFASCGIRLMTTTAVEPDIERAWNLLAQQDALLPPGRRAFEHLRGEMTVAGVIARRAAREPARAQLLRDSAHAVLNRVSQQVTPQVDFTGELATVEAYIRTISGEKEAAIALLERIRARDPAAFDRTRGEVRWYWRDLQGHPKFAELFGLN